MLTPSPSVATVAQASSRTLPPLFTLYLDDTGSRRLDRLAKDANNHPKWFALGGVVVAEDQETLCKDLHAKFYTDWPSIQEPLHLTDMRARRGGFSWLERLSVPEQRRFWREYRLFLANLPVTGIACVIHRPGYLARGYGGRDGDAKWNLCRSAFNIVVERAAKFVSMKGGRLRVKYEGADRDTDQALKGYFALLKNKNGLGFRAETSAKYSPMEPAVLAATLIDLERKSKSNKLLQIADTFIYAMARGRYEPGFDIYKHVLDAGRLATTQVPNERIGDMGIKYFCFDGL